LRGVLTRLKQKGAWYNEDPDQSSHYMLIQGRDRFRKEVGSRSKVESAYIEGQFGVAMSMSLIYGLSLAVKIIALLSQHGIRTFHNRLSSYIEDCMNQKGSAARQSLMRDPEFNRIYQYTSEMIKEPCFSSHPKLDRLVAVVVEHFSRDVDMSNSRVMIFSQLRESVDEIAECLREHDPLVRVMSFVGQSSGKKSKGLTQKEQLKIISDFTLGNYNVLVATCIGEEGLDIGEVDLIICYDSSAVLILSYLKSPIRMLQRIGRTGRKRDGRIVCLLAEGKEEQAYELSSSKYLTVQKVIQQGKKLQMYEDSKCRMLPLGMKPVILLQDIYIPPESPPRKKGRKSSVTANTVDDIPFAGYNPPTYDLDLSRLSNVTHWNISSLKDGVVSRSIQSLVLVKTLESIEEIKSEGVDTFAQDVAPFFDAKDINGEFKNLSFMLRKS
jgi:ERCC4-related helicase